MHRVSASTLERRRQSLLDKISFDVVFAAGVAPSRNYPANRYRFRASSHFLYFVGEPIAGAVVAFLDGTPTLFAEPPDADDALWHGPRPSLETLGGRLGFRSVRPLGELGAALAGRGAVTLPQARPVGFDVASDSEREGALADAVIDLRLRHDKDAITCLREVASISAEAHRVGMQATRPGATEASVMAAMTEVLRSQRCDEAYLPIVTRSGEVLHNDRYDNPLEAGDVVLADVGGEHPGGWAADITRSWPVAKMFSPTQRDVYQVVLDAQLAAIDRVRPGTRYREVHDTAKHKLCEGLVALGILEGDVDGLVERGVVSLFFPHGVGHLIGLDVHDMEDLGDRAGYAPGRSRSSRFGDAFLRLDRDLEANMAVTIEPGFYQVPAILNDADRVGPLEASINRTRLAQFGDVRGIRIEDDVLVTEKGCEVLSAGAPKTVAAIETLTNA